MAATGRNRNSVFNGIISAISIIGTVIAMVIVFKDMDNPFTIKFILVYAIFILLSGLYFLTYAIWNIRKYKWVEKRGLLYRFLITFIAFWGSSLLVIYLLKGEVNVFEQIFVPLGMAIGITFLPAKSRD